MADILRSSGYLTVEQIEAQKAEIEALKEAEKEKYKATRSLAQKIWDFTKPAFTLEELAIMHPLIDFSTVDTKPK